MAISQLGVFADDGALDVLVTAVERLSSARDELDVAHIVRTATRRLTGADGVTVVLKKGDRVHYVDEDAVGPLWKGQDFPQEACISGWAIMNKQTVVIEDVAGDPRIPLAAYQPTFVKSLAMAPVGLPNPIAAIGAYWATQRRPSDEEVIALEMMARAASVAMENVVLRRELRQALVEAKAADAAKTAFLAHMSREIRIPISGIATMADLLERTQLDPRQRQLCAVLKSSSQDVVQLVCDILDFAKIEAGAANLYREKFDLAHAVESAAGGFAARAGERGLLLKIDIADAARDTFVGDDVRVRQIVEHLVSNAVKFTDRGSVTVSVEEEDRVGVRSMFKICVADTGLGFDEARAEELFARFSQGEDVRGGAGLGLAIADGLARAMGGAMSATGKHEAGSTFTVRLPLERAIEAAPIPLHASA